MRDRVPRSIPDTTIFVSKVYIRRSLPFLVNRPHRRYDAFFNLCFPFLFLLLFFSIPRMELPPAAPGLLRDRHPPLISVILRRFRTILQFHTQHFRLYDVRWIYQNLQNYDLYSHDNKLPYSRNSHSSPIHSTPHLEH